MDIEKRVRMEDVIAASLAVASSRAYADTHPNDGTASWSVEVHEDHLLELLDATPA